MKQSRKDAIPYHMQSPVLLAQPLLDHALSIFLTVSLLIGIGFCAVTSYSRTEMARGEIAAASGFSALVAEESGVIGAVAVRAGQRVTKGQVLARLARPRVVVARGDTAALSMDQGRAILHNIDLQLAENGRAIVAGRGQMAQIRQGASVSSGAANARRGLTEQRKAVALKRLTGLETLAAEGVVTQMAVDQARVQSMQLLQETADADLAINEISRGRDERISLLEAKGRELLQAAAALQTERLQIEKQMIELQTHQELLIVSPQDGVVAVVNIRPGQRVETGQRVMAIASPDSELTAVLQVPSKAIGLIERGQRVSLKYDAFPFQTFGLRYGRVTRVESASLEADQLASEEGADRRFLVEIKPEDDFVTAYGRPRPLRVGMMLTADIEVERRSILAWWLAPLLSLTGRMA